MNEDLRAMLVAYGAEGLIRDALRGMTGRQEAQLRRTRYLGLEIKVLSGGDPLGIVELRLLNTPNGRTSRMLQVRATLGTYEGEFTLW